MRDALDAIQKRRSAIEAEIAHLRQRVSFLEKELPDLDAAERVLLKLASDSVDADKNDEVDTGKPEGTPPVSEMIQLALQNAHRHGKEGLTPQGILEVVRAAWWPSASTDSVGPIAWRMWKQGKLGKEGSVYFRLDRDDVRLERDEALADRHPQRASEPPGESGSSPETAQNVRSEDMFE